MNVPLNCRVCGHDLEFHREAYGHRECGCLHFIPEEPGCPEFQEPYQEAATIAILDLILEEKEGTVCIPTGDGRELRVKVTYCPEVGSMVMVKGGAA